jgi:riboflavin synthase
VFTGLIEEIGRIASVRRAGTGYEIRVDCHRVAEGVAVGDSISIDGACQTVTSFDAKGFVVFASSVTASITTLAGKKQGDQVNLERALSVDGRFGGHIVLGHVDGTGIVRQVKRDHSGLFLTIGCAEAIMHHIVAKGSVTVDGVSLTVVAENGTAFDLYLIPETIDRTTLQNLKVGDKVNIETDILAKYTEKLLTRGKDPAMMKTLAENGFL